MEFTAHWPWRGVACGSQRRLGPRKLSGLRAAPLQAFSSENVFQQSDFETLPRRFHKAPLPAWRDLSVVWREKYRLEAHATLKSRRQSASLRRNELRIKIPFAAERQGIRFKGDLGGFNIE